MFSKATIVSQELPMDNVLFAFGHLSASLYLDTGNNLVSEVYPTEEHQELEYTAGDDAIVYYPDIVDESNFKLEFDIIPSLTVRGAENMMIDRPALESFLARGPLQTA